MAFGMTPRPGGGLNPAPAPAGQTTATNDQGFTAPPVQGAPKPAPIATTPTAPAPTSAPAPTTVGSSAAPAPLPNLSTDPTYMEFVRSLGLSQADADAAAQQAQAAVGARLSNQLSQDQTNTTLGVQRTSGALASRGISNSGEALKDVNNLHVADAYRVEALRQAASQQLAQLAENLALAKQAGNVGLVNAGNTAAGNVFVAANPVNPLSPVGP